MAEFGLVRNFFDRLLRKVNASTMRAVENQTIVVAEILRRDNMRRKQLTGLHEAEYCVYSQWGEDGICNWLLDQLPNIPETFVEFGVENYTESNTRLILKVRNWRGLVIDGSQKNVDDIKGQDIYWKHDLKALCAFIDRDNINNIIESAGIVGDIGLLSIDIDGNDYWVWQAIRVISPAIVVCEYNAVLGDVYPISVPYRSEFQRTKADPSNLYFGASIKAMILLGQSKGYTFVGSTSTGANAFFVRNDYAEQVLAGLAWVYAFPSKFREARDAKGNLLYLNGNTRREAIDHLPFVDPISGMAIDLKNLGQIYSSMWASSMACKL
jgi:hypothetical protein